MPHSSAFGQGDGSLARDCVRRAITQSLQRGPAPSELAQAVEKISDYLTHGEDGAALSRQLAPDLMGAIGNPGGPAPAGQPGGAPRPATTPTPAPAPAAGTPSGGGPTGRVGEVARATLSAIDFPSFVASLIQGTFQAIVNSSIQQMEAYAELLRNVAGTVDRFMQDNVNDGMARDYVADQYGDLFSRDSSGGKLSLRVNRNRKEAEMPSFFQDLGFNAPSEIDDDAVEQVIVPAARRHLAEGRQRTLATMVLMGMNRVVVDDGEIQAKLQFHIDATEAMQMRFDQYKTSAGSLAKGGSTPFSTQGVMVNTASLNAQTEMNVRADLTGQVRVKFRSETFPLERFADSAAIQLINSNARVPQAQASLPGQGGAAAPAAPGSVPGAAPGAAPRPAPASGQAGLNENEWAPEE